MRGFGRGSSSREKRREANRKTWRGGMFKTPKRDVSLCKKPTRSPSEKGDSEALQERERGIRGV